ncbi:MAG: HAMP domain-containing sensor histidine kinase, partial [Actinomycetota bacterium]
VGEPDTDDEIQSLAQATNEVLARLDRQSAARRRFVADASHELKSPIANARVLVDTGERLPSPELRRRMGAELDRLQSLVDDLLFLARTDETAPPAPAPFDLDDVLFDEAERATLATELPIEAGGVRPARVLGDRAEVARAVRNLLDNAVRHARSRVTLAVEDGGDQWVVVVADDGAGVPAADRERIFERFTRLEADRARTGGGTGLGLSIVATIAGRNNGSVRLLDGPGARFELSLPAAPASPHPPS